MNLGMDEAREGMPGESTPPVEGSLNRVPEPPQYSEKEYQADSSGTNEPITPSSRKSKLLFFISPGLTILLAFLLALPISIYNSAYSKNVCNHEPDCISGLGVYLFSISLLLFVCLPLVLYIVYRFYCKIVLTSASIRSKNFLYFTGYNVLALILFSVFFSYGFGHWKKLSWQYQLTSKVLDGKAIKVTRLNIRTATEDNIAVDRFPEFRKILGTKSVSATFETKLFELRPSFYTRSPSWITKDSCYIYDHRIFEDVLLGWSSEILDSSLEEVQCPSGFSDL